MLETNDVYMKLRPVPPTAPEDLCQCSSPAPLKLMYALTNNPIHCCQCNLEVPPERWTPTWQLVEAIADWRDSYQAIYHLWLASGAYEDWAARELRDIASAVNHAGLMVCQAIAARQECYYWYFQDTTADDVQPLPHCPCCRQPWTAYPGGIFPQAICTTCSIITQHGEEIE